VGFVDLHSHILFGIDDGAQTADDAKAMLDALAALGVTHSCVTPHQKSGQFMPSADAIADRLAAVTGLREAHHPALRLGAENMWDEVFFERLQTKTIPHYAESAAFLFELPLSRLPVGLEQSLFKLRLAGDLPVLAHPERYEEMLRDPALTARVASQCAFVIDLPALAGYHGKREAKAARALVAQGLFHAVATDAHNAQDVSRAAEGYAWLAKHTSPAVARQAFSTAPAEILRGQLPDLLHA
jgi:protein-tyrosine phosphatase